MVAHHEVFSSRHHKVAVLEVVGHIDNPRRYSSMRIVQCRQHRRKLIEVSLFADWSRRIQPLCRLRLRLAVHVDDAIVQMNAISWHAYKPFHQDQIYGFAVWIGLRFRSGPDKHHYIPTLWIAMVNKRHPGRTESDAIHQKVV